MFSIEDAGHQGIETRWLGLLFSLSNFGTEVSFLSIAEKGIADVVLYVTHLLIARTLFLRRNIEAAVIIVSDNTFYQGHMFR